MQGFIAEATPALIVRTSGATLFHVAAEYLGDASLWYVIAAYNGLTDPFLTGNVELAVPQTRGLVSNGGILGL